MDQVLRVWGGSYHDYWFTEDAVLRVRLVPTAITVLGIFVLVILTLLLGIIGLIIGAAVTVLIYLSSGRLAKGRRGLVAGLTVQQVKERGMVTLRIPYSVVTSAEFKGNRLTLNVEGRKIKINVPQEDLPRLRVLIRSKLPDVVG
jgi:hypothetical protein